MISNERLIEIFSDCGFDVPSEVKRKLELTKTIEKLTNCKIYYQGLSEIKDEE